jgi:hypothetical protein
MEVLPFGLLVFVAGTLLLVNIWGVVDTKFAADAAAREAARWVVESAGRATPADVVRAGAAEVARATMADHGRRRPVEVGVGPTGATFERCQRITVEVETSVPAIRLPFLGGFGRPFAVRATHSELVDPTRAGVEGVATCIG